MSSSSFIFDPKRNNPQGWYWFQTGFTSEELDKIKQLTDSLDFIKATTFGNEEENTVRRSRVKWIPQNDDTWWLYEKMMQLAIEANDSQWNFDLSHAHELIQYTEYWADEKGHYGWHQDIGPGNGSLRKISITIQLSDSEDYKGGDLEIMLGEGSVNTCPRGAGVAVLFPSYMLHRVTQVQAGLRKSLVLWVGGSHYK
jgi:PKHD-type hydroxylase